MGEDDLAPAIRAKARAEGKVEGLREALERVKGGATEALNRASYLEASRFLLVAHYLSEDIRFAMREASDA